jgi:hypothetical protein
VFQLLIVVFFVISAWTINVKAQSISAGLGGGITYLGGLQQVLFINEVSALSGGLFINFDIGFTHINLSTHFAAIEDMVVSSFETNLLWFFPFKQHRFFIGGGSGLFGMPIDLSSGLHLSVQAMAGLEYVLLKPLSLRFSAQALQVIRLNADAFPGGPIFRIEVGLALPFGVDNQP